MKKYFAAFLAIALLLFGCAGQPTTGGQNESNETGGTQPVDLAGMGYEQLVALGIPVECSVVDAESNSNTTVFFKGGRIKGNGTVSFGGMSQENVFLVLENESYLMIPNEARTGPMAQCAWIKVTAEGAQKMPIPDPTEALKAAGATYECRLGTFVDSELNAPTESVCDVDALLRAISEMINATVGVIPPAPSPCEGILDELKKGQCIAACNEIADVAEKAECAAQYYQ